MEDVVSLRPLASFLYARNLVAEDSSFNEIIDLARKVSDSLTKLCEDLLSLSDGSPDEAIQAVYYEAGKLHFADRLRFWFRIIYQMIFKEDDGCRMGQFTNTMTIHWVVERLRLVQGDPWSAY